MRSREQGDCAVVGRDDAEQVSADHRQHLDDRDRRAVVGDAGVHREEAGAEDVRAVAERGAQIDQRPLPFQDEQSQVVRDDVPEGDRYDRVREQAR